jgi:hypothetical protein
MKDLVYEYRQSSIFFNHDGLLIQQLLVVGF